MKPISKGILATASLVVALGFSACNDENPWSGSQGMGGIRLTLTANPDYVDGVPSTRAPESLFSLPDVADFTLQLEKMDGSYSKTWSSLSDFQNEDGFPAGAYTLTAFYGSAEEEGFEKPYFIGSEQLTVLEERETAIEIETILANTLVSIEYTDAFRNYFASWGAEVHSAGHAYNAVPSDEERPVFVAPGTLDIAVDFTDKSNRNAKVQAASFEALPKHHYHVTIDVNNGNVGNAQIVISFDETIEEENVYIDLTDELFSSPAPTLTTTGFEPGQTFDMLEGTSFDGTLRFDAMARAGIASAVLTLSSETFTPVFGKEVDLCNASPAVQEQLRALGINVTGLFKNPGVFGIIDISGLPSALPVGKHVLSLIVKDKFSRVSDPVSVTFDSEEVNLELSAEPSVFGTNEAIVNVSFNGGDPSSDLTFKAMDNLGGYVDAPIIKSVKNIRSRALPVNNYLLTIQLPETDRNPIPVKAYYKGVEKGTFDVEVVIPTFTYAIDAFAGKAIVKVTADDPKMQTAVINAVRPILSGPSASSATFSRDLENGVLNFNGLTPASNYSLTLALGSAKTDAGSFATETATDVPNGNFAQTSLLEVKNLQVGGSWKVSPTTYNTKSSISRQIPDSWATLNDLTCWSGSSPVNSWFMVPSTFVENGVAIIRSVGYHHAGTLPSTSGGAFNRTYYNPNAPASLNVSAGELFLGSYTFADGRIDGVAFGSRPAGISFDYSYEAYNSESGEMYIAILDASGKVLASKTETLGSSTSMTGKTITFPAYEFGSKAARLELRFRSSTTDVPGVNKPTESALNEGFTFTNFTNPNKAANDYKAFAKGSELRIANVKLNY